MSVFDQYFIRNRSVDLIAKWGTIEREDVISTLRAAGLTFPPGEGRDAATSAILAKGYGSFLDYVKQRGMKSLEDQARELEVDRGALARTYDAFRFYLADKSADRGRSERHSDEDS